MNTVLNTTVANNDKYINFVDQFLFVNAPVESFKPTEHEKFITVNDADSVDSYGIRDNKVYWIESPEFKYVHVLNMSVGDFNSQLNQIFE